MKIAQSQQYEGDDWWTWKVWLKGPARDLAKVRRVTWHLHPTFPVKEAVTDDRASAFAHETAGWGTFRVRATVEFTDGTEERLTHELELTYPGGSPAPA